MLSSVYNFFMYAFYVTETLFCVDLGWSLSFNGIGIDLRFRITDEAVVSCPVAGDV